MVPSDVVPAPFLWHLHPFAHGGGVRYDQRPDGDGYPFDWDYFFHIFWGTFGYTTLTPLQKPKGPKGFAYQISAGGKKLVAVAPVPFEGNFGPCTNADWVSEIMSEIQAYLLRQLGVWLAPHDVGHCAVTAVSEGGNAMRDLMATANQSHPFREAYVLDSTDFGARTALLNALNSWYQRVPDGVVRWYTRFAANDLRAAGFDDGTQSTVTTDRVFVDLNPSRWRHLSDTLGVPLQKPPSVEPPRGVQVNGGIDASHVHSLIGLVSLTDAIRRSRF